MKRLLAIFIICIMSTTAGLADTFTNKNSGETVNGYPTAITRNGQTQVRIEGSRPRFLNLANWQIERNFKGRKQRIYYFVIDRPLNLEVQVQAFEEAIPLLSNQGPLFILFEIDTAEGRPELARRLANTITNLDNCTTVAFVSGGRFGGAFGVGAIPALACDKLFMKSGTSIGATPTYIQTDQSMPAPGSEWSVYAGSVAQSQGRNSLLARAIFDPTLAIIELQTDSNQPVFISKQNKAESQKIDTVWTRQNNLLVMTAQQAVYSNIADRKIDNRQEIFSIMNATQARQIRDTRVQRRMSRFRRARSEFEDLINMAENRQQRISNLSDELSQLQTQIERAGSVMYSGPYGVTPQQSRQMISWQEFEEMLLYRDQLLADLENLLSQQVDDLTEANDLAQQYPDLSRIVTDPQDMLNQARSRLTEIRNYPRFNLGRRGRRR